MTMHYEIIHANRLTPDLVTSWRRIQAANPVFHSPFLTPDWTQLVASLRADVEVAILEDAGEVVGFFPFQRTRWNRGKPVGTRMCDVQAVVAMPGAHWDAVELITACRLTAWDFHQLPASLPQFASHAAECSEAIYVDLSAGYAGYEQQKRRSGSHHLKTTARLARKAEREVGPLRFCLENENTNTLEQLLTWKSAQYRRTHVTDALSFPWIDALVRETVLNPTPAFGGLLFSLYFGEVLAGVELGLRYGEVLHSWITAYNRDLKDYSPGSILGVELVKALPAMGMTSLELGKNNLRYKASLGSAYRPMISGCVAVSPCAKLFCLGRREMVQLSRSPWMAAPTQLARRMITPLRGWLVFR